MRTFNWRYRTLAVLTTISLTFGLLPSPLGGNLRGASAAGPAPARLPGLDAARQTLMPHATEPGVLANPLSISRVQSSYAAATTTVVTFTVTNNQPPTLVPGVPDSATITDSVGILASLSSQRTSTHCVMSR